MRAADAAAKAPMEMQSIGAGSDTRCEGAVDKYRLVNDIGLRVVPRVGFSLLGLI